MQTPALPLCLALTIGFPIFAAEQRIAKPPAFPGAEGFGAHAIGGRGGVAFHVTNLNDKGPGSLRAACEADGPRTIVFNISGVIELKSPLKITQPFITIAGQTAPGDGVCLKNHPILISTHDVIIRYLRVRPGADAGKEMDAISINGGSRDVIVDHCSTSWGTDELISVSGTNINNITVQWCFLSESLNHSVHHKGEHGYGSLIRSDGPVTYHHNLYAHNKSRNPRPGSYGDPKNTLLDFRNNVIYDWGERAGYSAEDATAINFIGNYLKPGPSTRRLNEAFHIGGAATRLFPSGTIYDGPKGKITDDWLLVSSAAEVNKAGQPFPCAPVTTDAAAEAFPKVLATGGANLPQRDSVDQRVVQEIKDGKGRIIDSPKDVGGWPTLHSSAAPADSDGDGIPDEWEKQHGLNPNDPADARKAADASGYSYIEQYLNSLVPSAR